jgi:anti-sigma factor RsiW
MNQEQNIEQQLWAYIDGVSTNEERSVVEKLLQSNFEWKNKYRELLEVHQLMSSSEVEQPSMRFHKKCNGENCAVSYRTRH